MTPPVAAAARAPIGDARGGVGDLQTMAKTDPQKVLADQAAAIAQAKGDMPCRPPPRRHWPTRAGIQLQWNRRGIYRVPGQHFA
ncbi:MAG TPA: hypothetical protein VHT91_26175 [Kofleriaceae bacterium]|nr:hypothetical protein [Kofleriaceae bacterium]